MVASCLLVLAALSGTTYAKNAPPQDSTETALRGHSAKQSNAFAALNKALEHSPSTTARIDISLKRSTTYLDYLSGSEGSKHLSDLATKDTKKLAEEIKKAVEKILEPIGQLLDALHAQQHLVSDAFNELFSPASKEDASGVRAKEAAKIPFISEYFKSHETSAPKFFSVRVVSIADAHQFAGEIKALCGGIMQHLSPQAKDRHQQFMKELKEFGRGVETLGGLLLQNPEILAPALGAPEQPKAGG